MEVEQIYFLMLIGACIALLVTVVLALEKKHQKKTKARKEKALKRALRQQRRAPVRRQVSAGHTKFLPAQELIARGSQLRQAGESLDDSFAASGLFSDDEAAAEEPAAGFGRAATRATAGEVSKKFRSWS